MLTNCNGESCRVDDLLCSAAPNEYVEFHNVIDLFKRKAVLFWRIFSKRQRRVIISDVSYSLKGSEGDST